MRRLLLALVVLFAACHIEPRQATGPSLEVREVVVVPDSVSIDPLGNVQFQAYGRTTSGDSIDVLVQWSASAGSITSDAVYTADTAEGDATIVAQVGGGPDALPIVGTATVHKHRIVALLLSPSTVTLPLDGVQQFTTRAVQASGDTVTISPTYSSTGGSITASGRYTAGATPGAFRVIASRPSGLFDTASVTIAQVPVASVAVTPAAANVPVGGDSQLTATTKDASGNVLSGRTVTWTSDAPAVATVSATGVVSGLAAGSATITATSEGQSGSAAITVVMVPVASVQVAPATANLRVGTTALFIATTRDGAGSVLSGRTITWSSSAPSVASVSVDGLVSALASGSTTITATSEGQSGSSSVTVSVVPVASVSVTPSSATLRVGASVQLAATAKDSSGTVLNGRAITWSSSAPGVASVSASGAVSALAAGSATVTATSEGQSGTATISVTAVPVSSVTVSPSSAALRVGGTVQLGAVTQDSANNVLTGRSVTWSSSAPGIAGVSASGLVTALAAGSATITATSEGKSGTAAITITVAPVATVTVTPSTALLRVGTQVALAATTKDSAGNTLTGRAITWVSNAPAVATVSASGVVSAVAQGSASVTATSEGKSATATITVTLVPVSTVTVTPASSSILVGATQQLSAVTKDSAGHVLTGRTITWSSNAAGIAGVSSGGLVSAFAAGSVTITATSEGKSGSAAITVTSSSVSHSGWYVSPSGSSGGTGSAASPWDLQTGLNGGNGKVQPGDTVWLRGGTYPGAFSTNLNGTAAAPIVVRQYPGERATIDGGSVALSGTDVLTVNGSYTWYWGFEIMDSNPQRNDPNAGTGTPLRGDGVYVNSAHDIKLINLIVHDTGHGTYTEDAAHNIEIYGWIIYNGGTESSARSDGHGIYIKGDGIGWKIARDNVIFTQWGFGIHGYAQSGTTLKQLVFDGNVLFNNGTPSDYENPNMQLGGSTIADNDTVTNNMAYYSPGVTSSANGNVRIGYGSTVNGTAVFANNYIAGGTLTLDLGYWSNLTARSNTILASTIVLAQHDPGSASTQHWSGDMHYHDPTAQAWQFTGSSYTFSNWESHSAAADQASATMPSAPQVFVRPNRYEPGRATIVVYNWPLQSAVSVDLTGIVKSGSQYQVRNVQDIFGTAVTSGTYAGGTISIPMGGVTPPQPIGGSFQPLHKTGPNFDVFVVTSAP
jgi:uncharacterized protein YjdB